MDPAVIIPVLDPGQKRLYDKDPCQDQKAEHEIRLEGDPALEIHEIPSVIP